MDTKTCTKCKQVQHRCCFSKDSRKADGLRSHCKTCCAQYRVKHRQETEVYYKNYYKEHRDRIAQHKALWYQEHRKERAQRDAQWQKDNPEKCRAIWHRRRARKISSGGTHTAADVLRQGVAQRWRCWWCGRDCKDDYHIDHLVPLAKGGHNNPSNIVIACPTCNLKKSNKLPCEFIGRLL